MSENSLIIVDPKEYGIDQEKATTMVSDLTPILEERTILSEQYKEVIIKEIDESLVKEARELRLRIRDNRTKGIEKWHKANKEFYLAGGRFVDAIKNKAVAENDRMEEKLMEIEKYYELQEQKKKEERLKLRVEELGKCGGVPEGATSIISDMPEDVWTNYLKGVQKDFQDKIEAEKKAEEDRWDRERKERVLIERRNELAPYRQFLEEDEVITLETSSEEYETLLNTLIERKGFYDAEQARILAENERLKKESEEKEAALKAEREAAEAKQREIEEAAKKEREAIEAKAKKEREEAQRIADEKLAQEKAEREKIEKELAEKKAAEEKAIREQEEEKERQLSMGDKEKYAQFISEISSISEKYSFESKYFQGKFNTAKSLLNQIK